MLFTDVMTVYNHYVENDIDKWQRTVVRGVQWSHSQILTYVSGGVQTQTRVESITIPNPERYEAPVIWKNNKLKRAFWTLDTSDKLDIVVFGECKKEITDDYTTKDLFRDNQYVGTVSNVSDNRNRTFLKSIKVTLK